MLLEVQETGSNDLRFLNGRDKNGDEFTIMTYLGSMQEVVFDQEEMNKGRITSLQRNTSMDIKPINSIKRYSANAIYDDKARINRIVLDRIGEEGKRIREYHYDEPLKTDPKTASKKYGRGTFIQNGCWITDTIYFHYPDYRGRRLYEYNPITGTFVSQFGDILHDRIAGFDLDGIKSLFEKIGENPESENIECDDISFEPERRDVFYFEANNQVMQGVILRDFINQQDESDRRGQIVAPGGGVNKHSHALGRNPDGELLAPVGVTANNGNSIKRYNLSMEVAAADSPTNVESHSIEQTDRGWQYWLAVKKPNKPMPKNGISENWDGLDTPKGREEYWKKYGMNMDIAHNGMVILTDIPSGETTTTEFKGKGVILRAYGRHGNPLDSVEYDCDTRIAIHHKINGEDEEWDIGATLEQNKAAVNHGSQDDSGDHDSR